MLPTPLSPAWSREAPSAGLPYALFRARLALAAVATATALPTPLSPFLGASKVATWPLTGAIALLWGGFLLGWGRKSGNVRATGIAGFHLCVDVLVLTLLLALSGAAQNPFTILYFVPLALSTLVTRAWTWAVAGAAIAGFFLLLMITAEAAGPHAQHGHFFHHVVGMAAALTVAGVLITHFVHGIARTLSRQQGEILRLSHERDQDRFATSLGALAAGAAHELGTPLNTVQLLADEWGHMAAVERPIAEATMQLEIRRMKTILHRMTSTQLSAEVLTEANAWTAGQLAEEFEREALGVRVAHWGNAPTAQPRSVLLQVLRELVRNAIRASEQRREHILVELAVTHGGLDLAVSDAGAGMDEDTLERAATPFFSMTGGKGLGLFLAQVHVRQLGGQLVLHSHLGRGTKASVHLPLHPPLLQRAL